MHNKLQLSCLALCGLVVLGLGVATSGYETPIIAEEKTYSLNLSSTNNVFTGEGVYTTDGNKITFDYDKAEQKAGSFINLSAGGYIKNVDMISGLKSITASFSGDLSIQYRYEGKDNCANELTNLSAGETFYFNGDTPDYFYLTSNEGADIHNLTLNYSCSKRINSLQDQQFVTFENIGINGDGKPSNLFDGNNDTYVWLNGSLNNGEWLQVDYLEIFDLVSLDVLFKGFYEENLYTPLIQYSVDGIEFNELCRPNRNDYSFNCLEATSVRYLRFTSDSETPTNYWPSIAEIKLNTRPLVTYEEAIGIHQGEINNMFDGDLSTSCWFSVTTEKLTKPSEIALDYGKEITTESLHAYYRDGDYLEEVYYSLDGVEYTKVETDESYQGYENHNRNYQDYAGFEPITFRYLKLKNSTKERTNWFNIAEIVANEEDYFTHNFERIYYEGGDGYLAAFDGNLNTHLWFASVGKQGAYAEFKLQKPVYTNTINVTYGGADRMPGIEIHDGQNWITLNPTLIDENGYSIYGVITNEYYNIHAIRLINNSNENTGAWVKIIDISFKPVITTNGLGGIYQGSLNDMIDNNENTFIWFASGIDANGYIQLDYRSLTTSTEFNVTYKSGNNMDCSISNLEVSTNGTDWTILDETIERIELENGSVYYQSTYSGDEISWRYIRLHSPAGSGEWISVSHIGFNVL